MKSWMGVQRFLGSNRFRFRHGQTIHAARIGIGIFASLGIAWWLHLPNGVWVAISFLIVMASLQHHGNIQRRAVERAVGTVIGAVAGVGILGLQSWLGSTALTFAVMAAVCGICGFYAVGRGGYTAQLVAITLVVVAGFGTDPIATGLWRAVDVLIGIAIALALARAFPLYALAFWRLAMADALTRAAGLLEEDALGEPPGGRPSNAEAATNGFIALSPVLQTLRGLMPPVSRESGLAMGRIETIQRHLRHALSLMELATSQQTAARPAADGLLEKPAGSPLARGEASVIARRLRALGEGLESGSWAAPWEAPPPAETSLAARLIGQELAALRTELVAAPELWRR